MYTPLFQMHFAEARIEDLRRARATLILPSRSRYVRRFRPRS
jgi:hypothetical protein